MLKANLRDGETLECELPKLKVAGSNPVSRSKKFMDPGSRKAAGVFCY